MIRWLASKMNSVERRRHLASISLAKLANLYSRNKLPPKPGSKLAELILSYFEYKEDLIIQKKMQNADGKFCKKNLILYPEQPSFSSRHLKSCLFLSFF